MLFEIIKPKKPICIYALIDPDSYSIKYIGQTTQGYKRIKDHYASCGKLNKKKTLSYVKQWIKELKNNGKQFYVTYLEYFESDGVHLDDAEKYWISLCQKRGINLLNTEAGGRRNKDSLDKSKFIEVCKIRSNKPEFKQKISKAAKKMWDNEEFRKKIQPLLRTGPHTEETKKKMSDIHNDIKLVFKDEFGNIYNSLKEASLIVGVSVQTIHKAVCGQLKTAGGRKFFKISGGISNRKSRGK